MKIWILGLTLVLNGAAFAGPVAGDCSQILREYNTGKILISSTENAMGTRLNQLNDYGTVRYFESSCTPQGGTTLCEGYVVSSQARAAADSQPFDAASKQRMAWKIDGVDRLLLRTGNSSFFFPVTATQCFALPQGAFIRAKAANAREANLYQILLRKVP